MYHGALGQYSLSQFIKVLVHGLKLDATVAGYLTVIPLLLTIVSAWYNSKLIKKILTGYFAITAIIVAVIFAVDEALYGYWGFRLDATVLFYLQSPSDAMASVPIWTFVMQVIQIAVYSHIMFHFFRKFILPILPVEQSSRKIKSTLSLILLGGLLFIPIRGSVTTSTANVGMVYFSNDQFLNHSAINPVFSLTSSISKQQDFASQFNFLPEEERKEVFASLIKHEQKTVTTPHSNSVLTISKPNILIILLESFSANAISEENIAPNMTRLASEGISFTKMYANSFRTDRGIVAALNGYLAQPTTSIMKYPSKSQTLPSIAGSLREIGYKADMLYGGDINFTNMQSYFFSSGYEKITSDVNFPLTSRLNKWGTNDDVTFNHLYEEISKRTAADEPWLTTFLTLSSHEPFEVPFQKFDDPYLNSVAFTDSCIGNFIDKFRQLPIWENTLVIMMSDHGFRYPNNVKEHEPKRYQIPMLWLGGAVKEAQTIDVYANQTDLAATLLTQLGVASYDFTFSRDILSPLYNEYSFYTFNNGFGFIDSTGITIYDNANNSHLLQTGNEAQTTKGKALLQTLYDDLGNR